jgi:hypothetical protein
MPLDSTAPASRELIHPPLSGDLAATACTGEFYRVEDQPDVYSSLDAIRLAHLAHLRREFLGTESQEWLARHRV